MATTEQSHSSRLLEQLCEIQFTVSGFWEVDAMKVFLDRLTEHSIPLVRARKPIYVMGDFLDFIPQDQETATAIAEHLSNARKFGLQRVAILNASPLMKLQYKRVSAGLDVG